MSLAGVQTAAPSVLPLRRLLLVMAGVYTIQSSVGAMMFQGIPAVLRDGGVALDLIGLVSLFMLPWAAKFLWSPLVERWRLAPGGRRRSRSVILIGQVAMAALLAALALLPPPAHFELLFAGLAVIAVIAATVDIAGDGFMIENLKPEQRGWGNVVQVGGGYAGMMIGTGLFLVLVGSRGWQAGMLVLAGIALLMTLPCLLTREPQGLLRDGPGHRPSLGYALQRPEIRWGLLAMLLCQLGLRLVLGMTGPFMIDQGLSPAELGLLTGTLGTLLSLAAILLIGFPVRRWGGRPPLFALLAAQALVYGFFCLAAFQSPSTTLLSIIFLANSAVIAASFVALYTTVMDWTSLRQAGVDFTLFQCADALVSVVAGLGGGLIAEHFGYGLCFGLGSGAVLLCLFLLPRILQRIDRSKDLVE